MRIGNLPAKFRPPAWFRPGRTVVMTICHPAQNVAPPSNILPFAQPGHLLDASYDRALARQETELREALAKIQALRRQHDEITQLNGSVVGALFAAHDAA